MWRQRFGQRDNTLLICLALKYSLHIFTLHLRKCEVHVVKKSFSDPLMLKNPDTMACIKKDERCQHSPVDL